METTYAEIAKAAADRAAAHTTELEKRVRTLEVQVDELTMAVAALVAANEGRFWP